MASVHNIQLMHAFRSVPVCVWASWIAVVSRSNHQSLLFGQLIDTKRMQRQTYIGQWTVKKKYDQLHVFSLRYASSKTCLVFVYLIRYARTSCFRLFPHPLVQLVTIDDRFISDWNYSYRDLIAVIMELSSVVSLKIMHSAHAAHNQSNSRKNGCEPRVVVVERKWKCMTILFKNFGVRHILLLFIWYVV